MNYMQIDYRLILAIIRSKTISVFYDLKYPGNRRLFHPEFVML